MDTRLADHLLWRLRHRAEADAIDHAVERGILVEDLRIADGRKVRRFAPGPAAAGKSEAEIARLLQGGASAGSRSSRRPAEDDEYGIALEALQNLSEEVPLDTATAQSLVRPDTTNLLQAVRRSAEPPRAVDVATMLLVAQPITMGAASVADILEALRVPNPIITITGRVAGFEETFLDLLGSGLILPGKVATCKGTVLSRDGYGLRFSYDSDACWHMVAFQGSEYDAEDRERTARQVFVAARSSYPIIGICEDEKRLPTLLRQAARINLVCGPLDMGIIRWTMSAVLGEAPEGGITHEHASILTLADLALAIRPGTSVGRALELLDDLARMRLASADDGNGSGSASRDSGGKATSTSSASKSSRGTPGSGSERIDPAVLSGTDRDQFIPRIETLSGYGKATDWALSLKHDLALWQAGSLAWEDMSVKLLLSGPPGTGKTEFAKALCNSLRVPLIATSVATWLEPGYLGDVLKRMSAAFAEAEAAAPSILFIDEIDGIGRRGSAGEWNSYWDSLVNRALELLNGASKTSGVIVVAATNNPDAIDRALLRSGRLETHIPIPRPDTTALIGIIRHHLKDDLATVVASAPALPAHAAHAVNPAPAAVAAPGSAEKQFEPTSHRHPAETTGGAPS
ncbi:MAG: ATP-binding protein [Pseudaminobacter sp.]